MNQKKSSLKNQDSMPCLPLCEYVDAVLTSYFASLDGGTPHDLYSLVLEQVEVPLLRCVMQHVKNNQSKAAMILNISRGTLRKKLKQYNLEDQNK